ncbi:hypothetical protein GCM10009605_44850 [Nocardiopsis composta]
MNGPAAPARSGPATLMRTGPGRAPGRRRPAPPVPEPGGAAALWNPVGAGRRGGRSSPGTLRRYTAGAIASEEGARTESTGEKSRAERGRSRTRGTEAADTGETT